jgi:hypothetical protein
VPKRTAPPAREQRALLQPQAVLGTFCPFFSLADENSIFLQAGRLFCITTLCRPLSKEVASTTVPGWQRRINETHYAADINGDGKADPLIYNDQD